MKPLSERPLLLLLAAVQFAHIMDFMIMMPLGPQLMRELQIGPGYFSAFVAIYTVTSGVVGLLAAPFIDRFDRRKLLLLAYAGFVLATLACAFAQTASTLLAARALSGAFGGLSMSMVMAIIGDVVPQQRRRRRDRDRAGRFLVARRPRAVGDVARREARDREARLALAHRSRRYTLVVVRAREPHHRAEDRFTGLVDDAAAEHRSHRIASR